MSAFHVSYDLHKPGQDYTNLIEEIKASPACHCLQSSWLVATQENAAQLFNRLGKHLDQNDRILVSKVTVDYKGYLSQNACDWLRAYVN